MQPCLFVCVVIPVYLIAQSLPRVRAGSCDVFMCLCSCCVLERSDKVAFAPYAANVVGIFDVTTNTFETVSTGSLTGNFKVNGAAAVGSKIAFAPCNTNVVGILDLTTKKFETVSTGP